MSDVDRFRKIIRAGQASATPKKKVTMRMDAPQPVPEPEVPPIPVEIINDTDHPLCNKGVVVTDEQGNQKVVLHMPEGFKVRSVKVRQMMSYVEQGHTEFSSIRVVNLELDPMHQRSCAWYTPGKAYVEDFGAELSEHYDFDRPREMGTCSNPEIKEKYGTPMPACQAENNMAQCDQFSAVPVTIEHKVDFVAAGIKGSMTLTKTRKAYGFPVYAILEEAEGAKAKTLATVSAVDHQTGVTEAAERIFNKAIEDLPQPVEATEAEVPVTEAPTKEKYFDYVLT